MPSKGVVATSRPWTELTFRNSHPVLIGVHVRALSMLSKTFVDAAPVARILWFSGSNWMLTIFESRREITRFQVSPTSLLRNIPSRAASQMVPVVSTATELMTKSGASGFGVSQLSPPFTDTAMALRLAATSMFPDIARLLTYLRFGRSCLCQVSPASELTSKPDEVAAYHLLPASSRLLMRAFISDVTVR